MLLTEAQLREILPLSGRAASVFNLPLNAALVEFGIDSRAQIAAFVAQVGHESQQLKRVVESFAYREPARLLEVFPRDFRGLADAKAVHARGQEAIASRVYANQNGNGPESSGDGWRYRGRGLIQITGRENYRRCGAGLNLDLLGHPELLENPSAAARSAAWFWRDRGLGALADKGAFDAVTQRINGGQTGRTERRELWLRARKVLGA